MEEEYEEMIEEAKEIMRNFVTQTAYEFWLKPLRIEVISSNCIIVKREQFYQLKVVENQFDDLIKKSFKYVTGVEPLVAYELE